MTEYQKFMASQKKLSTAQKLRKTFNMWFPGISGDPSGKGMGIQSTKVDPTIQNDAKRLSRYQGPVQLARIKADLQFWRNGIKEAELPLTSLPYRVMMQQVYQDLIDNAQIKACIEKRQSLVLLKEFHICDDEGNTDEEATKLINNDWFRLILKYMLDAKAFGYTLVSFGDLVNGRFNEIRTIRRWNISPDRLILSAFQYVPAGIRFLDQDAKDQDGNSYVDWSCYIETPNSLGVSRCGYGYLHEVAPYGIVLRSLLGWNTDYAEMFAMPLRVGKTNKVDEERDEFEDGLAQMGAAGYMILDALQGEEIDFVESNKSATNDIYGNLEKRCNEAIAKVILGHPAAIDETPGKLGSSQGGKSNQGIGNSPAQIALDEKEALDSRDLSVWVNNLLIPKLVNLGFKLPLDKKFAFKDDLEQLQVRMNENKNNLDDANVMVAIKQAGGAPPWEYFKERTGITVVDAPVVQAPSFSKSVQNKLKRIYK